MANKRFSIKDIPLIRSFLDLFDAGEDKAEPTSKERALPTYKIYHYIEKQLALAGTVDYDLGGYCNDVYVDQTGMFAIVTKNDGKMYKAPVTVTENNDIQIGEWQEVVTDFKPVVGRTSAGIRVSRTEDGQLRWYAWPACTAALNRSGEIDSRQLFDSFIQEIERTGEYPELDFFHLGPDVVLGRADSVLRDDYAYCATGLFYDTDIARRAAAAIEADPEYWGNSIQYYPSEAPELMEVDGVEIPVYKAGVNRFISLLPEDTAASQLTSISTKGVNRMYNKKQKEALRAIGLSDLEIADLEKKSRSVNEGLEPEIKRGKTAVAAKTTKTPAVANLPATERAKLEAQAKALLKNPAFRGVLREELQALMPAEAAAAGGDGEDDNAEEAEGEESETLDEATLTPTERAIFSQLKQINGRLDVVDEIVERMDEEDEDYEEEISQILADMPSKIGRQKIIRARGSRNSKETTPATLASQATSVLERMKEARVS
jgi:hypothetical protein